MFKQRVLLRSLISFNDKKELGFLMENYILISKHNVEFSLEHHASIYSKIKNQVVVFTVVPSVDLLNVIFKEDVDISSELEKISKEKPLFALNFNSLLDTVIEEQYTKELTNLLKNTNEISLTGKKIEKSFLKGTKDAVEYLQNTSALLFQNNSFVISNGTSKDGSEFMPEYFEGKRRKKFEGLLVGIDSIDSAWKGIQPKDFWIIAAYTGELKTTLSLNFAYSQVVEQKKNVKFISLEMPYTDVLKAFYVMHSANLDLWDNTEWKDVYPLNLEDIESFMLSEKEERFLEFLIKDLATNPEYGNLHVYQPPDGLSISQLKSWAEMEYSKEHFDILYLDHIELLKDEVLEKSTEYGIKLNQRIKNLRQFTLNFNKGEGMRLVSAYQINRKGKDTADKNNGEYRLDALSYANEAERSATAIIYSYLNAELRANNAVKIGSLKHRSKALFPQYQISTDLSARKIYNKEVKEEIPQTKKKRFNIRSLEIFNDRAITDLI